MNLSFSEKLLLALYTELFNKKYDVTDEKKYNVGPGIFVRHVEMQNTYYLFQNLGIDSCDFSFMWDWRGPSSPGLQVLLNELDKKVDDINCFYADYINKRNAFYNNYHHQVEELLSNYLLKHQIKKVTTACYLFNDIVNKEMGSEYIAGTIYLANSVYPGSDANFINEQLNHHGYHLSNSLNQEIWKILAILDITKMECKDLKTKQRVLK